MVATPPSFKNFVESEIRQLLPNYRSKKFQSLFSTDIISTLTGRMSTFRIRTMPIFEAGKANAFSGTVTQSDVARYLPPDQSVLPLTVLRKNGFDLSLLSDGSKCFQNRTIGDVFEEVLNLGTRDESIATIRGGDSLFDAIYKFTQLGVRNRRYRTLVISEEERYVTVLSYVDVFSILLSNRRTIEGFLESHIEQLLEPRKITMLNKADSLAKAINTLDNNPFTHIPVSIQGNDVVGLIDEITVRSLQYDVIYEYEYVEKMQLADILENQRPNFGSITVSPHDSMENALKKFTNEKSRPKTLLVGELNSDSSIVSVINTLSYVDVMRMFLKFAQNQLDQSNISHT